MNNKVETKVTAATAAAVVTSFAIWLLEVFVFKEIVPVPVQGMVALVVPLITTFAAGWLTPHTPRTSPNAQGVHAHTEPPRFRE